MHFGLVVLCVVTILVNIVWAVEQPGQTVNLEPNQLVQERGHLSHHIDGDDDREQHHRNRECPRQYPLSEEGPYQVQYEFEKYGIVPDLLKKAPVQYLEVNYRNLSHHCQPKLGNKVDLCALMEQPRLRWKCSDKKLYTVILVDINPYGRAHPNIGGQALIWFTGNIPGCRISAGKPFIYYQPPIPFYGAGPSRYAILVYEQPPYPIDFSEEPEIMNTSLASTYFRCLSDVVEKYELILLAGNHFSSEFKPCIKAFTDTVTFVPDYMKRAQVAAKIPVNPYFEWF